MKVLVANPSIKHGGFLDLENAQRATWMSDQLPNLTSFFYYGSAESKHLKDQELYLQSPEGPNITDKTIKMFKYCLDNLEFDFLFRTNISSYVNINRLYKYCQTLKPQDIYQGYIGVYSGIKYASGSGILFSKDVVKIIIDLHTKIKGAGLHDDPYIGKILSFANIPLNSLPRFDYLHSSNVDSINKFHNEDLIKNFHYRCKTFNPFDATRKIDCERIHLIHQTISDNNL